MAMATLDNQQTWVPYETTKDCSQGFCSMYCPQWCYIIFPPPPPLGFEDERSGPNFSPLVIAIIGILASAFLLVSYYTIISKYCGNFDSLRRRLNRHRPDGDTEENLGALRHETWHISPSNGLDESLINKITVCKYRRGEGLVEGTDCSVCLSEFREDESLRLLPKCNHAFHLQCIDTWLESHSNCPLCRANIVSINPVPLQLPAPPEPEDNLPIVESERNNEMVVAVEDLDVDREEETSSLESNGDASKDPSHSPCDLGGQEESHSIEIRDEGIQSIRRSLSMDSLCRDRVSIADVLGVSMEEEFLAMTDHEHGVGSSRRSEGEQSKGSSRSRASLHSVMSPVPMKRSFSSGRFCFTRHGRGRSAVLPI